MDAREALDWRILEEYEPWGQRRDDLRFAQLCAVIMRAAGWQKANKQPFTEDDFLLRSRFAVPPPVAHPRTPRQTTAQMERRLESFFGGHNAMVREQQGRRQAR